MTFMSAITAPFAQAVARAAAPTVIVVPCYNEARRLNAGAFAEALAASASLSFVFVNDGSTDATLECLQALQLSNPLRITVVDLPRNGGKAEAVRQGLIAASRSGAALIGYWDADLATPLDAIADFERVMTRYDDINVAYGARRQLLGHRINRTVGRRAVSRICAGLARLAVGLPISDTQCGAKLLRNTPLLQQAIAQPFTAGWLFDVELFSRLAATLPAAGRAFYEMPLAEWHEIPGSKVTSRAILRSGVQMLRLIARRLGRPSADMRTCEPMLAAV